MEKYNHAISSVCTRRTAPGRGCAATPLERDERQHARHKADGYLPDMGESDRCPDCNAKKGQFHHVGCSCNAPWAMLSLRLPDVIPSAFD